MTTSHPATNSTNLTFTSLFNQSDDTTVFTPVRWKPTEVFIAYQIKLYYTPVLVCCGVLSNVTSFLVLSHHVFGRLSFSHYLRAIHCVNILFLLMLFGSWMTQIGYNVYDRPFLCQLTSLLLDASSFLITWFSVAFCVDRYICICWQPEASKMCTSVRARLVIICLSILTMCIYLNTSLTVGVVYTEAGIPICTYLNLPFQNKQSFTTVDEVVNHILPLLTILILTSHIWYCLRREARNIYTSTSDPSEVKVLTLTYLLCFMMLNLPQEIWCLVSTLLHDQISLSPTLYLMKTVLQYLSDTNTALSVVILLASYPVFRQYLKNYLQKLLKAKQKIKCKRMGVQEAFGEEGTELKNRDCTV